MLLGSIMSRKDADKVVIVSNSTAALDLIQMLCDQNSYSTVRIDGNTDTNKRQDIVNSFNLYDTAQVRALGQCKPAEQFFVARTEAMFAVWMPPENIAGDRQAMHHDS